MTRVLVWVATLLALPGCAAFHPEEPAQGPASRPVVEKGEVALTTENVEKKQTVDLRGRFKDGVFLAEKIQIQDPDEDVAFKTTLEALDGQGRGKAGGIAFQPDERTKFVDAKGEDIEPTDFRSGDWVKVEAREHQGVLVLRKLTRRERKPDEHETLQGPVAEVLHKKRRFTIAPGIAVEYRPEVLVVWDAKKAAAPAPKGVSLHDRPAPRFQSGILTIKRDEEDERPADQLRIANLLAIGGEVKYELELREEFDLDQTVDRDRLIQEFSTKIEVAADVSKHVFAFLDFRLRYEDVLMDQNNRLDVGDEFELGEAFVLVEDLPIRGLAFQAGRQDFDHGREWVMDENLDAFRAYVNLEPALVELSVSARAFDTTPENDDVWNWLAGLHVEPIEDQMLFAYVMHRSGGSLIDLERTHFGVSMNGKFDGFEWWAEAGGVVGSENGQALAGFGFDVTAMYVLEDEPLEPSLYAGFAWGSGDDDPADGVDHNFRQTGLNDNTDRFNGVVSFRYYGELVRFDLTNLAVFTAGFGLRPAKALSVDFLYHRYRQVQAAPFLPPTRLRQTPNGEDAYLGSSLDLIIGFKQDARVRIELNLSWFIPGEAFARNDSAFYLFFSTQYNF